MIAAVQSQTQMPKVIQLSQMQEGTLGYDHKSRIWLRTIQGATCLSNVPLSYPWLYTDERAVNLEITLFPPGTVVNLTQE